MAYPSTIGSLTTPQATDRLNNPSHSALHQNENTEIIAIETFVGTLSSIQGSLVYDIRATASDGGGHIQGVNKGGTNQTSYTKGDLLVASSASVLTKLAVSSVAGDILTADPNVATGVKWATGTASTKITARNMNTSIISTVATTAMYSASIAGSVIGTSNAIRFTADLNINAAQSSILATILLANTPISTFIITNPGSSIFASGKIEGFIAGNGTSSQVGNVYTLLPMAGNLNFNSGSNLFYNRTNFTSSIESGAAADLVITMKAATIGTSIFGGLFVVEKIQ